MASSFHKNPVVQFLASLKLAVIVIVSLIVLMTWGTFTESYHNAQYAKWQVYLSPFFVAVEVLLFLNILFAALVRLPWKKRLSGFYITHIGLMLLLIGSAVTAVQGIDGNLRLFPNEPNNAVTIQEPTLYVFFESSTGKIPREKEWPLPKTVKPYVKPDKAFAELLDYSLFVEEFLPYALPQFSWKAASSDDHKSVFAQIHLKNFATEQTISLNSHREDESKTKLGPLSLQVWGDITKLEFQSLFDQNDERVAKLSSGPKVVLLRDQVLAYGKNQEWSFAKLELLKPVSLPWMGLQLTPKQLVQDKIQQTQWNYSAPRNGDEDRRHFAARLRLQHKTNSQDRQSFWIDDVAMTKVKTQSGREFEFLVGNRLERLPFQVRLDRFKMDTNPGTNDPASYESFVTVQDRLAKENLGEARIFMNNPLKRDKYTLYQASYFQLKTGEYGSVLTVNHDPGRFLKYLGSALIVFGSALHFWLRSRRVSRATA